MAFDPLTWSCFFLHCQIGHSTPGPGGVLGSGVPESARFQGFSVFPVTGYIELDSADIDTLVADGRLGDFVKQQFGFIVRSKRHRASLVCKEK